MCVWLLYTVIKVLTMQICFVYLLLLLAQLEWNALPLAAVNFSCTAAALLLMQPLLS